MLCVWILPQTVLALNVKKQCGQYTFHVKMLNVDKGDNAQSLQYLLYFQASEQKKKLFYKTKPGSSLEAACIKTKAKKYLMLFQEPCEARECPNDTYGIFDPDEKKLIFNPVDWPKGNGHEIETLTGRSIKYLGDYPKNYFCCSIQLCEYWYGHC